MRLYTNTYRGFDAYSHGCFYAYRLMAAAEVVAYLLTRVNTLPENEAQVRLLVGLDKELAPVVWERSVTEVDGEAITGPMLKRIVAGMVT